MKPEELFKIFLKILHMVCGNPCVDLEARYVPQKRFLDKRFDYFQMNFKHL